MRFAILGTMLAFTCATARLMAAEYFIDYAGGADVNDGRSAATAWRHCPGDPAATDRPAQCALAAGDSVIFKGGVTYEFTGATGIRLAWDGAPGLAIVYDGSGRGTWGSGRARFTDYHGDSGRMGFFADGPRHDLEFRALELTEIGGSETLPADMGAPVAPRYGGGIAFLAGASDVAVRECLFSELGYWFNQRPMSREAIAGAGLVLQLAARRVSVSDCEFTRVANGCDLSHATELSEVSITRCTFHDFIVWPINLPLRASGIATAGITIGECSHANNGEFDTAAWSGYGNGPYVELSIVSAGGSVRYVASATGSPAPSFQWQKNGVPLAGATSATLALGSLSLLDAGIYTAVATNTAGSVVSNSVVLVVTPNFGSFSFSLSPPPLDPPLSPTPTLPVFTREPASTMLTALQTATFSASATGTPAPTYQWFKNGLPLGGRTADTLVLPAISTNDAGTYAVAATNTAGSVTSRGATLTVLEVAPPPPPTTTAPAFIVEPQSQTAAPLSRVILTAQATGSPEPSYQWLKNGLPIAAGTSATLELASFTSKDAGTYTVAAVNTAGTVLSRGATLTMLDLAPPSPSAAIAPTFVLEPQSQSAVPFSTAGFIAQATGSPEPNYQWLKNGQPVAGWTNAALVLPGLSSNDSGTYAVIATNSAGGVVSRPAMLRVESTANGDAATFGPTVLAGAQATVGLLSSRVTFVVEGSASKQVLVRALGPSLASLGLGGLLGDPRLELWRDDVRLSANDDWGGDPALRNAFAQVGAIPLTDPNSKDAALLVWLPPGTYTAVVSGPPGATGVALTDVYQFP